LTVAQMGSADKATFNCEFYYVDANGADDFSEAFDITFRAPILPTFTLAGTIDVSGSAHVVTLSPAGVAATASTFGGSYVAGTVVTLTPTGATFVSWGGTDAADLVTTTGSVRTILMNENKAITATFT
jgi:hypothetical protein